MASQRTENVSKKLEAKVKAGEFYEAQQMYLVLYNRYAGAGKVDRATDILVSGTCTMLEASQLECASELCKHLMEHYNSKEVKVSQESLAPLFKILALFPENCPGRDTFVKTSIRWSKAHGTFANGEPAIHNAASAAHRKDQSYAQAQKHYLNGTNPVEFSDMLVDWSREGVKGETDLFICQAVLAYLERENLRDANIIFDRFLDQTSVQRTPLINFVKYLLLTLERDALPLFKLLKQKYAPSIARDPRFAQSLDNIARIYFNVQPPQSGMGGMAGMIQNMMQGFGAPPPRA